MSRNAITFALCGLMLATLPGCVRTVTKAATLPFRAANQTADWATTSRSEADRNSGKKLRKKCEKEYNPDYCDR
jgi:hypothetical protein